MDMLTKWVEDPSLGPCLVQQSRWLGGWGAKGDASKHRLPYPWRLSVHAWTLDA